MRIFPSRMPELARLVEGELEMELCQVPLGDEGNIFHFDKAPGGPIRCLKKDAGRLLQERGLQDPISMQNKAKKAFLAKLNAQAKQFGTVYTMETMSENAYNIQELQQLSLPAFFEEYAGASKDDIAAWYIYSGYNVYPEEVQASIFIKDGAFYGSDLGHQYFVTAAHPKSKTLRDDWGKPSGPLTGFQDKKGFVHYLFCK